MFKLLSTPEDPSRAIGEGVLSVVGDGEVCGEVIHGTTVATNALLERRGAKVALVTTAGFEDLLVLARQTRPELYALRVEVAEPLVERALCFGVRERVGYDGGVRVPLSEEEVQRVVEEVARSGADAVVICLLHSYANGDHEERLAAAFRGRPEGWHVTASREVTATFREYERASTAAINGYVGPVMARYFERLQERLKEVPRIEVLQSHGGRGTLKEVAALPVHTALSGPAGGVVGALKSAEEAGFSRVITFDMGGTSTDVSLAEGEPTLTRSAKIGGLPLQVPVVDLFTVGAGGGSEAYRDAGGALKVGPRSAGAEPGPVAYGRGGAVPTVTDAHVVLGTLVADRFLGGEMTLDEEGAREAVEELAASLGMSWRALARGILDVADAAMARAIKVVSLERGYDPREYALVAFGGAGGLHGCRLAEQLEMSTVIVPRAPGVLSAMGMIRAPGRRLMEQTLLQRLEECLEESEALRERLKRWEEEAGAALGEAPTLRWTAGLRYVGQTHAVEVDVDWGGEVEEWGDPRGVFEAEHQRLFGYVAAEVPVEVVDLRLMASGAPPAFQSQSWTLRGGGEEEVRRIDMGEGPRETPVVPRESLEEGERRSGPAVITEYSGTTVVLPGWIAEVRRGHLVLSRGGEG